VHGEGVAIGMACAFRFSHKLGICPRADMERAITHLATVGLPTKIQAVAGWNHDAKAILEAMYQDKKVERGALTFILAKGIGKSFVAKNIRGEDVLAFLEEDLAN
jgi:shikimate kinase/3-dehydroquinate synthase